MVQASDGSVMWLTRDDTHGCTCVLHTVSPGQAVLLYNKPQVSPREMTCI